MNNNTYYQDKLETLPEDLQYAVMMCDWKDSLIQIQKQFKLHIDQTQVLEDSTVKLMFGDIDAPDFINNMFNEAHINSETAADILLEVDLRILKNIRSRLQLIEESNKREEELEEALMSQEEIEAREDAEEFADYYEKAEQINKEIEDELLKNGILPDGSNITDDMLGIKGEKEELQDEIDNPSKTFTLGLTKNNDIHENIKPDHQIQNTHIETPFHEEDILPKNTQKQTEIKKPISINLDDLYREPIE